MSLKFNCPHCTAEIVVKYLHRGESAKCHVCGSSVTVPTDALEGEFEKPDVSTKSMTSQTEASEGSASPVDPKLVGIGGWLILPAISFILGPIIGVVSLIVAFSLFSDVADAGLGGLYSLELLVQLGLLVFLIYAATRFFGKKSNAPSIIIALLIVSLVASGALLMIELGAGAEVFAIETGKQLVRDIIGAAIWIPYFKVSNRVKATFVN